LERGIEQKITRSEGAKAKLGVRDCGTAVGREGAASSCLPLDNVNRDSPGS